MTQVTHVSFDQLVSFMRKKIDNYDKLPFLKSNLLAGELKCKGNTFLNSNNYIQALDCYNKALINCPMKYGTINNELLALLLANRSLTFYQLQRFEESLLDLKLALEHGYPVKLRDKLLRRKLACERELGSRNKIVAENEFNRSADKEVDGPFIGPIEVFSCEKGGGRGVRATKQIKAGQKLLIEPAYTGILLPEYFEKFCYNCLKKITMDRPFPCSQCNQVRYCGPHCAQSSWEEFHSKECCYLDLLHLIDSSLYSPKMVLKVILREHSLKSLLNFKADSKQLDLSENGVDDNNKFSFGYQGFEALSQHSEDSNDYTKICAFIIAFIGKSSQDEPSLSGSELIAAKEIVIKHIRRCQVNSMHLTYREMTGDPTWGLDVLEEKKIGCALFLAIAMTNHSCDPNAKVSHFDGYRVHLTAIKNVDKLDELTISYGLCYKWHFLAERKKQLKESYFFDCNCLACQKKLQPLVNAYRCPLCQGPIILDEAKSYFECLKCKQINPLNQSKLETELEAANKLVSLGLQCTLDGSAKKLKVGEKLLRDGLLKLNHHLHCNNTQIGVTIELLTVCYIKMGNYEDAVFYCKKYLHLIKCDFDDDVYLFNSYIKLIKCYELLLLEKTKQTNNLTKQDDLISLKRETVTITRSCLRQLELLLPAECSEATFYRSIVDSVEKLCC